jgi:protein Tex
MSLNQLIAQKTWLKLSIVDTIIELLDEGNTVPFIARYRKELTEGATDEQLRDFHDIYMYTKNLESRKADIIRLIDEKGLMTDELRAEIMAATTLAKLEDLYRPYKEKKMSKASIAKAKGLDPLAVILRECQLTKEQFETEAKRFVVDTGDKKTTVATIQEAIQWAMDIVAEDVSDHAKLRDTIRNTESNTITLQTKATKKFEPNGVYKIYGAYNKKLADMPSYAYLAVCRAEEEKQISLWLQRKIESLIASAQKFFVPRGASNLIDYLNQAIEDGLKRLLIPSLERELRSDKKRRSDEAAIKLFWENLKQLLLTPPVRGKTVLWFDPGYRTGCKLAVMDETGKFLAKDVIYPTAPQEDFVWSEKKILELITKHSINLIVIGNGTWSRESSTFVDTIIKKHKLKVDYMVVSEAGASVYSASKLAQEEFPDLDVTVRGAISIGHRVQDPLAELTKVEPKAIGVGQYQHDVDQKLLGQKLDEKVENIVNSVGVDVNTASYTLLQHIAGLTSTIAKNIVSYRDENWSFSSKSQLKKTKGLWPKAYEQCVGFLRILDGKEPLDATGIHPEMYEKVYGMIDTEFGIKKKAVKLPLTVSSFNIQQASTKYDIWLETLEDIIKELQAPGRDPRDDLTPPSFAGNIMDLKDLKVGDKLQGVVRNITDFGAFVDIGLHNDGLVHKSQIADRYVAHPMDVVSLGQSIEVRVLEIDLEREKVSLSMKTEWSTQTSTLSKSREFAKPVSTKPVEVKDIPSTLGGNINWG